MKVHLKSQNYNMYILIKRSFDIIFSLIVIVFLLPLFLPVIIILRFTGEGEVFYFQKRIGLKNKDFIVFKFATMLKNSENMGGGIYTSQGDKRILPFGHFLRKSKINELPQIFNILLGTMSFVGPRPLIEETFNLYNNETKSKLFHLKPGLTGIGSVIFRNEEEILKKSKIPIELFYSKYISPYKGNLEVWYSNKISFIVDFLIIALTAWVIFFPKSNIPFVIFRDLPVKPKIFSI